MTEIIINLFCDQVYFLSIVIIAMELISFFLDFNIIFIQEPTPLKDDWRLNFKVIMMPETNFHQNGVKYA